MLMKSMIWIEMVRILSILSLHLTSIYLLLLEDEATAKLQLWYHPYSDILARLRALGAFAFSRKQLLESEMNSKQNKKGKGNGKKELITPIAPTSEKDETHQLCEQLGLHHVCLSLSYPSHCLKDNYD